MSQFVRLYLVSVLVFFGLDLIWLGVVAEGFYDTHLGYLLADSVRWEAAIAFYLLFVGGIVHFVTIPATQRGSSRLGAQNGVLFGVVTYAAFDLTCLALFRDFPLIVVAVDLAWGGILVGTVAWAGSIAGIRWNEKNFGNRS